MCKRGIMPFFPFKRSQTVVEREYNMESGFMFYEWIEYTFANTVN